MCRPSVEHRLEPGQALQAWSRAGPGRASTMRDLAGRLAVGVEDRRLDRHDLAVEAALRPGRCGLRLGAQRRTASRSARVRPRRWAIRSAATNWLGMSMAQRAGRGWPASGAAALAPERDPAHRLDAAGDADVDGAGRDQPGDQVRGLLGRAALGVEGQAARLRTAARRAARRSGSCCWTARRPGSRSRRRPARPRPGRGRRGRAARRWAGPAARPRAGRTSTPPRLPIGVRTASTITAVPTRHLLP